MSEAFIGEIRLFGINYAPRGWVACNGQLLPIASNTTLFSVIGTSYGGDGRTTFAVPNMQGRAAMHYGSSTGPGLSPHQLGEMAGYPSKTVTAANLPPHTHTVNAVNADATSATPAPELMMAKAYKPAGRPAQRSKSMYTPFDASKQAALNAQAVGSTGQDDIENNYQSYQVVNYCICLEGIYPSRS